MCQNAIAHMKRGVQPTIQLERTTSGHEREHHVCQPVSPFDSGAEDRSSRLLISGLFID